LIWAEVRSLVYLLNVECKLAGAVGVTTGKVRGSNPKARYHGVKPVVEWIELL
jgi:hypothetical protein